MKGTYKISETITVEELKKEYTKEELKDIFMFEGEIVRLFLNNANSYFIDSETEKGHKIYIPTEWVTIEPDLQKLSLQELLECLGKGKKIIRKFITESGKEISRSEIYLKDGKLFINLEGIEEQLKEVTFVDGFEYYKEV